MGREVYRGSERHYSRSSMGTSSRLLQYTKVRAQYQQVYQMEGEDDKPGLVRLIHYCVSSNEPQVLYADLMEKENSVVYVKERLLTIDDKERILRYELIENNIGLRTYEAAFRVEECEEGCNIVWSYSADPIEGMAKEDMEAQRTFTLDTIVQKIQSDFSA